MKVLLYSHAFHPSLGGVETVSMTLAQGLVANGIDCKVVTQSEGASSESLGFDVVRKPGQAQARALVRWADVVLFNGASLALQPWVLLARKPFVWVHVGYQAGCIDGLGWVDNAPAPMTPWASVRFHARRSGWPRALREGLKLALRRAMALHGVDRNVAITHWMDAALPLPRQQHIYNPFPIAQFAGADRPDPEFDFFYMGRIVQEKGVDVLVRAFARVLQRHGAGPRLLLIGDGGARADIERLVSELGLSQSVVFAGKQSGPALVEWVARGGIGVLPSVWYEPMGGVAIELMAAGKCLIVSAQGGLAECVGDAGLVFPNGDVEALSGCMLQMLQEPQQRQALASAARLRSQHFLPERFVAQYIALLQDVIARR